MADLPTDEARRALADRIDRAIVPQRLRGDPEIKVIASWETWQQILASLRAKTAGGAGELDELRRLSERATPGEFTSWPDHYAVKICPSGLPDIVIAKTSTGSGAEKANATFLAAAGNYVRRALDPSPQGEGGGAVDPSASNPSRWELSEETRAQIREIELATIRPGDPRLNDPTLIGPTGPAHRTQDQNRGGEE